MQIIKSTGEKVEFDPGKIAKTLRRTGAGRALVEQVIRDVEKRLRPGMDTKRLHRIVMEELRAESRGYARRYDLRDALLRLGPAGFKFEKYVASVLRAYGYRTDMPEELQGHCVFHEVDVVARKDNRTIMIEAKFRNEFSRFVKLKDTLATWARFQDLNDGAAAHRGPLFDHVWIVTNGKISGRSRKFGLCKGIQMIGWKYPRAGSLAKLVDHIGLYPITVLDDLAPVESDKLAEAGLTLCREVADRNSEGLAAETGLSKIRSGKIIDLCRMVVHPEYEKGAKYAPPPQTPTMVLHPVP